MRRFTLAAGIAALVMVCPSLFGAIATELVIKDSIGDQVTIDVSDTNVVTVTCNSGNCGQITQANVGTKITSDGAHGTISVTHATFGGAGAAYTLSDTADGGADNTLPTLMDFNQINAEAAVAGGTLTSTFTDTGYVDLSSILNVADSNVTDTGISGASTIDFNVLTSTGYAIPATTNLETNTLAGHSGSNGAGGVNVANPNNPNGSLTSQVIMHFSSTGSIQANISISNVAVPEPASIALLGTLVFGLTAVIRRKHLNRS